MATARIPSPTQASNAQANFYAQKMMTSRLPLTESARRSRTSHHPYTPRTLLDRPIPYGSRMSDRSGIGFSCGFSDALVRDR